MSVSAVIDFALAEGFEARAPTGGLGLGVLESQYEELFAEVLEDGVITEDERQRLEKAARNLGLDKDRLDRLEEAMTAAYESHHRMRVVDQTRLPQGPFAALAAAPPISVPARANDPGTKDELTKLRNENRELRERIQMLTAELEKALTTVNVEVDLGNLEAATENTATPEEAWKRVRRDPTDCASHRALYESYARTGERDGQLMVARALSALGAASDEQLALVQEHRQHGLIQPQAAVEPSMWASCLLHPEQEPLTGALFSVIAPAILIGRVTTLRRDGKLTKLPDEMRQDPARTTIMAVRALPWAAALLGLGVPPIYIDPKFAGAFGHLPGVPPASVVGSGALSGKSVPELAFLSGRHVCFFRAEHFVRTLYSATEDLEDLFLAALIIANPKLPLRASMRARIEPLARAIEPLLEPQAVDTLRGHYLRFAEEGGRTNLQRWSSAVDRTSARVGLALAQDLDAALKVVAAEEGKWGPSALDLLAYSTSERFLRLRRSLGIGLRSSGAFAE